MYVSRRRKLYLLCLLIFAVLCFSTWVLFEVDTVYDLEPGSLGDQEEEQYVTLRTGEPAREGILLLEGHGQPRLTFRMWCALESAARAHPHQSVTLLMTSPVIKRSLLLQNLTSQLPNMRLLHLDTGQLFHGSPLEDWYREQRWTDSQWPLFHFNDALRWLLLWKYGGVYLDLDVVVLRALTRLPNCTALESHKWVAAGVLKFTPAHPLMRACLDHLTRHFDGSVWGANGPELLTQVLTDRCGLELPSGRTPSCPDVSVLPPRAFYPLPWWDWQRYVTDDPALADDLLADPRVFVLHVWNLHTRHALVRLSSQQPYARAARASCPVTVAHAGPVM